MRRYRTEIVIPASRLVTLLLPEGLPTGRATVLVVLEESADDEVEPEHDFRDDYEWWEEFGDATEADEPDGLAVRLVALES